MPPHFSFPVRVYYEDTDAAGVVYYANYLRYLERSRTEWLASIGHPLAQIERAHGIVFVVRRAQIDFRMPARLGDLLDVGAAVVALGRASLVVRQDVRRGADVVVEAVIELACVDAASWKPRRIPITLPAAEAANAS